MASWRRVMAGKPCGTLFLNRRWCNLLGYSVRTSTPVWPVSSQVQMEVDSGSACLRGGIQYMAARFFAAPVQVLLLLPSPLLPFKCRLAISNLSSFSLFLLAYVGRGAQVRTKEEPKDMRGPRLNEAITAKYIRLVTDQGHAVVSREEALDRARRLDLDLVEVQSTAKPPVCKIMDFHKVKYAKETMEKARAKAKSELTIRKGDFKEVRLKGKIEQKDIEVKAETVKGLIERGYRVKCMALPSKQRGTEEFDLGALLSRLTDLIEDVIIVESGPFVEKQQAYVVVRHVKFGSKKGSRKTATKTTERSSQTGTSTPVAPGSANMIAEAVEPVNVSEDTGDDILSDPENGEHGLPSSGATAASGSIRTSSNWTTIVSDVPEKFPGSKTVYAPTKSNWESGRDQIVQNIPPRSVIYKPECSSEKSNTYNRGVDAKLEASQRKSGWRNERVAEVEGTPESSRFSSINESNRFNKSPHVENSRWVEQRKSNQANMSRQSPAYGSQRQGQLDSNQGRVPPGNGSRSSSYGLFSSQKPSPSGDRNREKVTLNNNIPNTPKSEVETTGQSKQGGWGIFSSPNSDPSQDHSSRGR